MARPEITGKKQRGPEPFSIEERLDYGSFSVREAQSLAGVSNTKFYNDVKKGLVQIIKRGSASSVPGPSLKRYMGLAQVAAA
ncbi:hypothetical protein WOC76_07030 [Methylocystis sp. IM3]|uniref:hypothetical protein n=1 Tax=unclassified Methylocystis TaxID=2625913 RepID=UPI0030F91DBE